MKRCRKSAQHFSYTCAAESGDAAKVHQLKSHFAAPVRVQRNLDRIRPSIQRQFSRFRLVDIHQSLFHLHTPHLRQVRNQCQILHRHNFLVRLLKCC